MSYSVFLSNEGEEDYDIFPFSGNSTYDYFWKKMILKFDFKIIGLLNVQFEDDMYKDFLREMYKLVDYLESLPDNEDNDKGQLERIYFILDRLKEKKHKYKYMSIG